MTAQIFKIRGDTNGAASESKLIRPTRFCNLFDYVRDLIPDKLVACSRHCCRHCCRKSRKQRGIEKARKILEKEVNIVDIVKSRRYFNEALIHLLSKEKRRELIARSQFTEVNPSSCSSDTSGSERDEITE